MTQTYKPLSQQQRTCRKTPPKFLAINIYILWQTNRRILADDIYTYTHKYVCYKFIAQPQVIGRSLVKSYATIIAVITAVVVCLQRWMPATGTDTCTGSVVGRCVCVLGTLVSCEKTAEPIAMPFGRQTHVGPGNLRIETCSYGRHLANTIERKSEGPLSLGERLDSGDSSRRRR